MPCHHAICRWFSIISGTSHTRKAISCVGGGAADECLEDSVALSTPPLSSRPYVHWPGTTRGCQLARLEANQLTMDSLNCYSGHVPEASLYSIAKHCTSFLYHYGHLMDPLKGLLPGVSSDRVNHLPPPPSFILHFSNANKPYRVMRGKLLDYPRQM